jgi:hypothetical protein
MCPQVWHIRRCTHVPPIARQSSQPAIVGGSSVMVMLSVCVQVGLIGSLGNQAGGIVAAAARADGP